MKSLGSYELLNNHVFYRFMPILKYLDIHSNLTSFEREAICSTIMDALVDKGLINPQEEFLDLENRLITNLDGPGMYHYDHSPLVRSIPLWIKEEARKYCLTITGGIPISVFLSRPADKITRYCVYDPNTALSYLFQDFSFIEADYDSPTRAGIRVHERPFLEACLNGVPYLFDILTKRAFNRDLFAKQYHLIVKSCFKRKDFTSQQIELYEEQTKLNGSNYDFYLMMISDMHEILSQNDKCSEMFYEIEMSKKYFPDAFIQAQRLKEEINQISTFQYRKK